MATFDPNSLRARIAAGDIKPSAGSSGPKVGEGIFLCLVEEALYAKGLSGNPRGMIKVKVLEGGTEKEVGGTFNLYLQTQNPEFMEQTIALYTGLLVNMGVDENKIFDAESMPEVITNICTIVNKMAMRGGLKFVIKRKEQAGLDPKGNKRYFNDILPKETLEVVSMAPAATEAPAATPKPEPVNTGSVEKPWKK